MSIRCLPVFSVALLLVAGPLTASEAPAGVEMPRPLKPAPEAHPDGSASIAVPQPRHGVVAHLGADGRVRLSCTDVEHTLLDKRAHERLHDADATAWE